MAHRQAHLVRILATGQGAAMSGNQWIFAMIPWWLAARHVGVATMPLLVLQIVALVTVLPVGSWIQRRDDRVVTVGAELLRAGSMGSLALVAFLIPRWALPAALLCLGLFGVAESVLKVSLQRRTVLLFGASHLLRFTTLVEGIDGGSAILAPVVAGWVLAVWGFPATAGVVSGLFLLSAASLWRTRRDGGSGTDTSTPPVLHPIVGWRTAFHFVFSGARWPLSSILVLVNGSSVCVELVLSLYMVHTRHWSTTAAGAALAALGVANVLSVLLLTRRQRHPRFVPLRWLSAALVLAGAAIGILAVAHAWVWIAGGLFLLDGGLAVIFVMAGTLRNLMTPPDHLAGTGAVLSFTNGLARLAGMSVPGLILILHIRFGVFVGLALAYGLAAVVVFLRTRQMTMDEAAQAVSG